MDKLKRKKLPKSLRLAILFRDNYTCQHCGVKLTMEGFEVDHLHPVRLGGGNEPENLVASCADCNRPGRPTLHPSGKAKMATFRMTPSGIKKIRAKAEELGISQSQLIALAIEAYEPPQP